jgi:hypothetical protein
MSSLKLLNSSHSCRLLSSLTKTTKPNLFSSDDFPILQPFCDTLTPFEKPSKGFFILNSKGNSKFISKKSMCMQYRYIHYTFLIVYWIRMNGRRIARMTTTSADFTYLVYDFCVLLMTWGISKLQKCRLSSELSIIRKRHMHLDYDLRDASGKEQESEKHAPCSFWVEWYPAELLLPKIPSWVCCV